KVYRKRWFILTIATIYEILVCIDLASFGQINNVLAELWQVKPWQVDWLNLTTTTVYIVLTIPFCTLFQGSSLRKLIIAFNAVLTVGLMLVMTGLALPSGGFPVAIIGQIATGISVLINFSTIPHVSAVWFPSNEVATAVAVQWVGRGVGSALGAEILPLLVNAKRPSKENRQHLVIFYGATTAISLIVSVLSWWKVDDRPPTPPSFAQQKVQEENDQPGGRWDVLREFKEIVTHKTSVVALMASSTTYALMPFYTILLSSILRKGFPHRNGTDALAGRAVMFSWAIGTVASLASGPLISRTKAYKPIVLASMFGIAFCCVMFMIAFIVKSVVLIYVTVVALGIVDGVIVTSQMELIAEVIYPKSTHRISQLLLMSLAVCQMTYIGIGRVLLSDVGSAVATNIPPCVLVSTMAVVLLLTPIPYNRTEVNSSGERE
uniref:Major facilitator superfamily (MFS) profile domain-containing protein n=1 Tax=Ciona savignyi TaxID=51511 RepID=H2Y7V9_CIOSA